MGKKEPRAFGPGAKSILLSVTLVVCLVTQGESRPPPMDKHMEKVNSSTSVEDVGRSESVSKSKQVMKRSAEDDDSDEEYVRHNFPMIISKKSATVLNKLITTWRNAMDQNPVRSSDVLRDKELTASRSSPNHETVNLQRRNQKDRKNYLRCYFNAVSCF